MFSCHISLDFVVAFPNKYEITMDPRLTPETLAQFNSF